MNLFLEIIFQGKQLFVFDFALHIVLGRFLWGLVLFSGLGHEHLFGHFLGNLFVFALLNQTFGFEPFHIFQLVHELVFKVFFLF
jgi:hypothetical protein